MNRITDCKRWLHEHEDLFIDLVRIYLGAGLLVKGVFLMGNRDYLFQLVEGAGNFWFAPMAIVHYVILAHLVGGILLAIGLFARVAVLFQIPVLIGAVFYLYLPQVAMLEQRQNLEFSALVLFLLVLLGVYGSGRWSLDYWLSQKSGEAAPAAHPASPLPR